MGKTWNDLLWWEANAYSGQLFKIRFSGSVLYSIVSTPRRRPTKHLFLPALQERKSRVHNPLSSPVVYFYNFFRSADFEHNKQVSRRRKLRSQINNGVHEERNPATILFEMFHKSAGDINDKYLFYMCFSSWANGTNRSKWNCRRISYWNRWVNKLWNRELCVWENLEKSTKWFFRSF